MEAKSDTAMEEKELRVLQMRLKSGQHDRMHLKKASEAIDALIALRQQLESLKPVCDCSCCLQVDKLDK